jgi:hypothetical protein
VRRRIRIGSDGSRASSSPAREVHWRGEGRGPVSSLVLQRGLAVCAVKVSTTVSRLVPAALAGEAPIDGGVCGGFAAPATKLVGYGG